MTNSREKRVMALAQRLSANGQKVTILGTSPHITSGSWQGVKLVSKASLDPTKPGGFLYNLLSVWYVVRAQSDVVHAHGMQLAFIIRLMRFLLPRTTLVLTIDSLPDLKNWLVRQYMIFCAKAFTRITTPTRQLQYRLLTELGLRVTYVPDGYSESKIPMVKISRWRLQEKDYLVLLDKSVSSIRALAKIYKKSGLKTNLVVLHEKEGAIKRLSKNYPFVKAVGDLQGRSRQSLLAGASGVVLLDNTTPVNVVLETMNAGCPIVAVTDSTYQETLGVTGLFVKEGGYADVVQTMAALLLDTSLGLKLGRMAKKRAQRHFQWDHILEEYKNAYHALNNVLIPLDSARLVSFTRAAETVQ